VVVATDELPVAKAEHRAAAQCQRGTAAARKGGHLEKELARLVGGYVVPMSGALDGKPNDVVARNGWRLECKCVFRSLRPPIPGRGQPPVPVEVRPGGRRRGSVMPVWR